MNLLKILNKIKQAKEIPFKVLLTKIIRKTVDIIKLNRKLKEIEKISVFKEYSFDKNSINYSLGLKTDPTPTIRENLKSNPTQTLPTREGLKINATQTNLEGNDFNANPTQTLPTREGLKINTTQTNLEGNDFNANPTQTNLEGNDFNANPTQTNLEGNDFNANPTQTLPTREGLKTKDKEDLTLSHSPNGEGFESNELSSKLSSDLKPSLAGRVWVGSENDGMESEFSSKRVEQNDASKLPSDLKPSLAGRVWVGSDLKPSLAEKIEVGSDLNPSLADFVGLANLYYSHKFNLLGSGWVNVSHNGNYPGFHEYKYDMKIELQDKLQFIEKCISSPNQEYSKKLIDFLPDDYHLIDWQRDFRSGYRWSELKWHKLLKIAEQKGAEIKLPWELGRMQHLIAFYQSWIICYKTDKYLIEFQNQIIDFIASNPPGFGLQWFNSMEAAIRVSNWIIVYNLFKNSDAKFYPEFEDIFINSVITHGEYIFNNLEWSDGMRGNHYFSNITGLIYISIFLNGINDSNNWLEFAVKELINETFYQFYDDGGNFEHSTPYHLFVVEMLVYALVAIGDMSEEQKKLIMKNERINKYLDFNLKSNPTQTLPTREGFKAKDKENITPYPSPNGEGLQNNEKKSEISSDLKPSLVGRVWVGSECLNFNTEFQEKLSSIFEFSSNLLNENQSTHYSGDIDSGYFFRYAPVFKPSLVGRVWVGSDLKPTPSEKTGVGSVLKPTPSEKTGVGSVLKPTPSESIGAESFLKPSLVGRVWVGSEIGSRSVLKPIPSESICAGSELNLNKAGEFGLKSEFNLNDYSELSCLINMLMNSKIEKQELSKYEDFGIFIYNKEKYSASVTFGKIDKRSKGAHSHNDLLALNLDIDGVEFLVDTGTYNYTAIPELRNKFRSTSMHNTLQLENIEQNDFIIGSPGDLFWLKPKAELNLLKCDENEFIASHNGFCVEHKRHLIFEKNKISGKDYCDSSKIKYIRFYLNENVIIKQINKNIIKLENGTKEIIFKVKNENIIVEKTEISHFYGEITESSLILVQSTNAIIEWEFEII